MVSKLPCRYAQHGGDLVQQGTGLGPVEARSLRALVLGSGGGGGGGTTTVAYDSAWQQGKPHSLLRLRIIKQQM